MVIRDSVFELYNSHTELEMWQFILDFMTSVDPRITCNTTVAAQFSDPNAVATFDFNIDNQYILRMFRGSTANSGSGAINSSGSPGIRIHTIVNDITYGIVRYPYSWRYEYAYDAPKTGENYHLRMKAISDTNYILIWVGLQWGNDAIVLSAPFPPNFSSAYLKLPDNSTYCSALATPDSTTGYILRGSFYRCSDGASNFTVANTLLNFNAGAGNLSYTQHCPILNNGQMEADFTDFTSCSTITLGTSIALENGNTYLAIGDHTLAPLTV